MQFYRISGKVKEISEKCDTSDQRKLKNALRQYAENGEDYNRKLDGKAYAFISGASGDRIRIGLLVCSPEDTLPVVSGYLNAAGMSLDEMSVEEITFRMLDDLARDAEKNDYIDDVDRMFEQFELDAIRPSQFYRSRIEYGEKLIKIKNRTAVYKDARRFLAERTMQPELDRIYAGRSDAQLVPAVSNLPYGHPAHYLVSTDDSGIRKKMYKTLLSALCANGRLKSRRYCYIDVKPDSALPEQSFDLLYKSCEGGTMVIRYLPGDDTDDDYASAEQENINIISDTMKKYRNSVLTVLCLPGECTAIKEMFYGYMGNMSMVEISEDGVTGKKAEEYLEFLAKEHGTEPDSALYEKLDNDNSYLALQLQKIFDSWYDCKLKNDIFPQYSCVSTASSETAKAEPKGSAYDELMEMTGLSEAKKVIKQALAFNKARKLFRDKGICSEGMSMHMVFTGNPGTAKTTAARLFARIMRDNRVLSKGHIVETGRSDLVGKYVGWTADIIKKKFREAMGGVLFVDEAYALVDGRSGSFGDEAINTIVQEMENHREDVVVIFAGYPDRMQEFLDRNPGLRSRIAYHVPFDDYDPEELMDIAGIISKKNGLKLADDAQDKLEIIFRQAVLQKDFGNGRFVRNIIEKARMAQASRLLAMDPESVTENEVCIIRGADIEMPEISTPHRKPMGFCA